VKWVCKPAKGIAKVSKVSKMLPSVIVFSNSPRPPFFNHHKRRPLSFRSRQLGQGRCRTLGCSIYKGIRLRLILSWKFELHLLVERNTRITRLVNTWDLHSRPRLSSSAALNLKLEALDVELRLADVALVQTNVLNANEVLARRDVILNSPLKAVLLPAVPGCVNAGGGWVLEAGLSDLDPVAGTVVGLDRAGGLGDVDEAWAGVLDELVVEDLDPKSVFCCSV
jgi:hypothetical protein